MKKTIAIILSLAMLLSATACSSNTENTESSQSASQETTQSPEPVQLENKMTETELSRVNKHALTLLDEQVDPAEKEHKVSIEFKTETPESMLANLENTRDKLTDEEYEKSKEVIDEMAEKGEDHTYPRFALIDGFLYLDVIPSENDDEEIGFSWSYDDGAGETEIESATVSGYNELLEWFTNKYKELGYSDDETERQIYQIQLVHDAIQSGSYETLPEGSIDLSDHSLYGDPFADYRDVWEYDRTAVEAIKDSVDEINIYDEEMEVEFLVHVTLPPDYDKDKTYPVFFLTDGVWRFGNHTELRKVMENGESADVILVSLGYDYRIDGTDEYNRFTHLVQERNKLLDFITDNLMPYLGENYNIDYANSTLYGHSDGGVFSHNALFHSDLYDNQPFGNYIIGSPAFWCLYNEELEAALNISLDPEGCQNDYGYFTRNDTLDKKVFLCGGSEEDPDYADKYKGHDTTLEGLAKINDRLESHNADIKYKLYESHHYQFIPEMLIEFLKETYTKQS